MKQKTIEILSGDSRDSRLTIFIDKKNRFNDFMKLLEDYNIKFSEVSGSQYTLSNTADINKCRQEAVKIGFFVIVS